MSLMRRWLYIRNRSEPLRQATLLLVLSGAAGRGDCLLRVLEAHHDSTRGDWSSRIAQLITLLETGHPLSTALMLTEELLPASVTAAIAGAEESGAVAAVMRDEADRLIQQMANESNRGGMMLVSAAASGTVVSVLFVFVAIFCIPKLADTFGAFRIELPAATLALLDFGQAISELWYYLVLPGACAVGWGLWYSWKNAVYRLLHGSPLLAGNRPKYWVPGLLRIFSTAMASGTPLATSMNAAIQQLPPGRAADRLFELRSLLDSGRSPPDALENSRLLRRRDAAFLRAAAAAGHEDWGMRQLAEEMDERRRKWAQRWRMSMVYVICGFVSLLVLWLALATFLPMTKLIYTLASPESLDVRPISGN